MPLSSVNLQGQHILVTRPQQQSGTLITLIEQHGGQAIAFPTLEIVPVINDSLKQQLKNLKAYQWLIFISANAVNFAVAANNGKIEPFTQLKIAAVGKATEKALENVGLTVDLVPKTGFNSEALLATDVFLQVKEQRILIVRGEGGREILAQALRERGAMVDYLEVYQRIMPVAKAKTAAVLTALQQGQIDMIIITSGQILQNLLLLLEKHRTLLFNIRLVVVSERIEQLAKSLGFKHIVVSSPDDRAILNTMVMLINGEDSGRRTN